MKLRAGLQVHGIFFLRSVSFKLSRYRKVYVLLELEYPRGEVRGYVWKKNKEVRKLEPGCFLAIKGITRHLPGGVAIHVSHFHRVKNHLALASPILNLKIPERTSPRASHPIQLELRFPKCRK